MLKATARLASVRYLSSSTSTASTASTTSASSPSLSQAQSVSENIATTLGEATAAAATDENLRVLSGIQPTGVPHVGNYLGAINNWVKFQEFGARQDQRLFMLADLHCLTGEKIQSRTLRERNLDMAAALIGCGLNPKKCIIFAQSDVPQHTQLAWIFSCMTRVAWLKRMHQFKSKSGEEQDQSTAGLLTYPVLQAADILLYKATHVPTGEDQAQHLELSQQIATTFNFQYQPIFPIPAKIIEPTEESGNHNIARVMSLIDGTRKMSKSDPPNSRISLTDTADEIHQKIRRAKSDSIGEIYPHPDRPEITNLLRLYAAMADVSLEEAAKTFASSKTLQFKEALTAALIQVVVPIGDAIKAARADETILDLILTDGANAAKDIARNTMNQVNQLIFDTRSKEIPPELAAEVHNPKAKQTQS